MLYSNKKKKYGSIIVRAVDFDNGGIKYKFKLTAKDFNTKNDIFFYMSLINIE